MRLLLFCIFLYLVGVIQAAPTINTTDTTISDSLEAPSFTTRTLWSIISGCVLTLFACTYTAIHTNIPSPEDSPIVLLLRRLWIMIVALIAPELIVVWALRQWLGARCITREFEKSGYPNVRPESEEKESVEAPTQHGNRFVRILLVITKGVSSVLAFFRRLPGAFVGWVKKSIKTYFSKPSQDNMWTQTHSFFVLMGGFMLYVDGEPCLTLRRDYILKLIRKGYIDVPVITAEQIHDKSKGNAISKGLIILQVAWFVMQLITRAIYHLEITQLEVGTFAFAVLNFLTYAVWWNKPLNVQHPHPVYWKSTESRPEDLIDVDEGDEFARFGIFAPVVSPMLELIGIGLVPTSRKLRVPTFDGSIGLEKSDQIILTFVGLLMAAVFGGIHCVAWFFAFPSHQEQMLWRMSAVAINFTSFISFFVALSIDLMGKDMPFVYLPILFASPFLYITARAVLLVLMLTTLRNLPPDAYKGVLWTSLVPHL